MQSLPYVDVDYCKYDMPYKKRTRLWNTIFNFTHKPLCKHDCAASDDKRHFKCAQRGPNLKMGLVDNDFKQDELYIVPAALVEDIFEAINSSM